ncbi:hypothetical protein L6164_010689 [Bauhinia variegata]|uniref:Uncharacterized protein n=1 Tax=Bauhinia variegata TaxID=167791 RepID=A0ACB9PP24_BAUVA|nr:hypothetical protein L6164_010689 [Bauhinia variegata]
MGSMNWLGFSLSSQDHSQSSPEQVSGTGECFHPTAPHSLNHLPPPIFEAFNSNTHDNHTQDWNYVRLKGLEDKYKSNSESSSLYGSQNLDKSSQQQEPQLENFLGSDHRDNHATSASVGDYMFSSLQLPLAPADQSAETSTHGVAAGAATGSNIGLSMIKTWLRNQPIAISPSQEHNVNNAGSGVGATNTQSLSLSMTMSSLLAPNENCSSDNKQPTTTNDTQSQTPSVDQATPRKSVDTFGQRTSIYRGVTRHRWTGRYEAHLWDNSCRREGQTRKGRQGGYDKEEKAARAYDLAALKYWGTTTTTNFPISNYEKELEEMKHMTRQEYVASLRRKSSGFSRGASIYRGVTRHHQHGRWQARIGRVAGNKDLYLGTFSTQEEAAEAYDIAAIKFRGLNAVTNFDMSRYDVKSILESSTLPIGGAAKRLKEHQVMEQPQTDHRDSSHCHGNGIANVLYGHGWPALQSQSQPQPQPYAMHVHYPYGNGSQSQGLWCKQERDSDHCNHGFVDLRQLHLAGNTQYNWFHSSTTTTSMDSSSAANSMDNSCGSNSISIYGGDHGYGGSSGYAIPMATSTSTVIANDHDRQNQTCNGFGDENQSVFYSLDDPYHAAAAARNLYNYSSADVRTYVDQQGNTNTNWVPTAIPRSSSTNILALCSGAPPFPLLHD